MTRTRISVKDASKFEDGILKSVDLSALYQISKSERKTPAPLLTRWAEDTNLNLMILPTTRINREKAAEANHLRLIFQRAPLKRKNVASLRRIHQQPTKIYPVVIDRDDKFFPPPKTGFELEVPFGAPRFVNATTLKAMLSAPDSDLLLRKVGKQWEICPDSFEVDLMDASQVFRLGKLQIYS